MDGRTTPEVKPRRAVPLWRRALLVVLWPAALVAAVLRIVQLVQTAIVPGVPWSDPQHHLVDYRDLIVVPGQYFLGGGNPYDPAPYLAAHPWVQEFNPYAPAWLLLAIAIAPWQYLLGAVIHQILLTALTGYLVWVLCSWARPRWAGWADVAVPIGILWLIVWRLSSAGIENGGTIVTSLGVVLVVRAICRELAAVKGVTAHASIDTACAVGRGLALVKPQFGIPLAIFALIAGRGREVLRGVIGLAIASVPIVGMCSIAAGGFGEFLRSGLRNVAYANSPHATTAWPRLRPAWTSSGSSLGTGSTRTQAGSWRSFSS